MKTDAKISECEKYRYSLRRIWDENKSRVAFIALNPSTADEVNNDKTIERCIDFAKSWGAGGMYMFNVFAYRATDPTEMKAQDDPIGSENDKYLAELPKVDKIIVCWGNGGLHRDRANQVREILQNTEQELYCLDTWIQHRSATHPNLDFTSSGVLNPSTFLGRLFKLSSID